MHLLSFTRGIARPCYEITSVSLDGKIILCAPILQFIIKILTRDHGKKLVKRAKSSGSLYTMSFYERRTYCNLTAWVQFIIPILLI